MQILIRTLLIFLSQNIKRLLCYHQVLFFSSLQVSVKHQVLLWKMSFIHFHVNMTRTTHLSFVNEVRSGFCEILEYPQTPSSSVRHSLLRSPPAGHKLEKFPRRILNRMEVPRLCSLRNALGCHALECAR